MPDMVRPNLPGLPKELRFQLPLPLELLLPLDLVEGDLTGDVGDAGDVGDRGT